MRNFKIIQIMSICLILTGFVIGVYFSVTRMSFETGGKNYVETTGKIESYDIFPKMAYCAYSTVTISHTNTTCAPRDSFYSCDSYDYYTNRLKVDKDLHYYYPIGSDEQIYYNVDDLSDCLSSVAGRNYGQGSDVLKGIYYSFLSVITIGLIVLVLTIPMICPSVVKNDDSSIELDGGSYSQV